MSLTFSENSENVYRGSTLELRGRGSPDQRLRKATVHSPIGVTPDKHFEKPTAFISPISRSMRKMPKSLHVRLKYIASALDANVANSLLFVR